MVTIDELKNLLIEEKEKYFVQPEIKDLPFNGFVRFPERNAFYIRYPAGVKLDLFVRNAVKQVIEKVENESTEENQAKEMVIEHHIDELVNQFINKKSEYELVGLSRELNEELLTHEQLLRAQKMKEYRDAVINPEYKKKLESYKKYEFERDLNNLLNEIKRELENEIKNCKDPAHKAKLEKQLLEVQKDAFKKKKAEEIIKKKEEEFEVWAQEEERKYKETKLQKELEKLLEPEKEEIKEVLVDRHTNKLAETILSEFKKYLKNGSNH